MPIFEFYCQNCAKTFEKLVFKDIKICCPNCKSENCDKLISNCSFKINGYNDSNGYSKNKMTTESIIKDGPTDSINKMKHNMR